MPIRKHPHLIIAGFVTREAYRPPKRGFGEVGLPTHSPSEHASYLRQRLDEARIQPTEPHGPVFVDPSRSGIYLEFESEPHFDQFLERLEKKWVRLLNARQDAEGITTAVAHIDFGKLHVLERMLEQYGEELTASGAPRHRPFFDTIQDIRAAVLKSFWTDPTSEFPTDGQAIWWEVWLRAEGEYTLDRFREAAAIAGVEVSEEALHFPDRIVTSAFSTAEQLSASVAMVDSLAELRRLKTAPTFFVSQKGIDAQEWIDDLLGRTEKPGGDLAICLLDTGVNHGHPLIKPLVDPSDFQSARAEWGPQDVRSHGTQMAGLALFGDLADALESKGTVSPPAALESVKILPNTGVNDARLYGAITADAVHEAEIQKPDRRRLLSMAITTCDGHDEGRPSSWSAAVDQLSSGLRDEPARLFFLSAGNMRDRDSWKAHPDHLATKSVEDPAQSWNALTVGAMTERWTIEDADFVGWNHVAEPGDLSPSSSTSASWNRQWPLKPDIVAEGGNAAISPDESDVSMPDSLRLLTTHFQPLHRLFTTTGDTSAACTLAARMGANISAAYPDFWPETIRGLLVHSAEWTEVMRSNYHRGTPRQAMQNLLRHCGYGAPNLDAALRNASNELTLIAQESIQPFVRDQSRTKTNEIHVYSLPWPKADLLRLGEVHVELRVTLSYFIEPHPGERGWKYRHRYQSHGLRFDVRAPHESLSQFRARLNDLSRDDGEDISTGDADRWALGPDLRHKGSVHSDHWNGTAAELAEREHIAVFPVTGWWKEYAGLGRAECAARYSLIVSIRVPEVDVDIYTPVALQIGVPVTIET